MASLLDLDEVTNLVDHASRRGRVLELDGVSDAPQTETLHNRSLRAVEPRGALHERHFDGAALGVSSMIRHDRAPESSSSSLPRRRAMNAGSFKPSSPAIVARTTLCGFADPSDLVRMLAIPAASTTARTAPPAMMPVPSGAGFSSTLPAPKLPTTRCGIVVPASGTRIRFFFAASIPFLIADGTSLALPTPKPTTPCPSPTTTRALKLRFLPPLTTFVTRLIETTVSLMSSCDGSMRSRVRVRMLLSQGREVGRSQNSNPAFRAASA